jgi:glutaredoxin
MKKWTLAAALCLVLATTVLAAGKVYMWTDDSGVTHIGASPPKGANAEPVASSGGQPPAAQTEAQIDLYVTDWCPYCKKAASFLRGKGKAFKEYNIERDAAAARRKQELTTGGGVPFAVICGQKITGFAPQTYEKALAACPQ